MTLNSGKRKVFRVWCSQLVSSSSMTTLVKTVAIGSNGTYMEKSTLGSTHSGPSSEGSHVQRNNCIGSRFYCNYFKRSYYSDHPENGFYVLELATIAREKGQFIFNPKIPIIRPSRDTTVGYNVMVLNLTCRAEKALLESSTPSTNASNHSKNAFRSVL